jgi:hypothetical protein
MPEIISGNPVFISWAQATLLAEGIGSFRADQYNVGTHAVPEYRLVIAQDDWERASAILRAANPKA